jgi:hypothetical protein
MKFSKQRGRFSLCLLCLLSHNDDHFYPNYKSKKEFNKLLTIILKLTIKTGATTFSITTGLETTRGEPITGLHSYWKLLALPLILVSGES